MLKVEFRAMGCQMAVLLDNEDDLSARALKEVPGWFEEWEQVLSRFRPDSNLNQLNASAGLHPVLWQVIQAALETARATSGLVVPTVLDSMVRAGYDRSFDLLKTIPSSQPGQVPSSIIETTQVDTSPWEAILLNEQDYSIALPAGVKLDLGGIGKGWAAWQAMQRLEKFGPVLIDAGGDIAISDVQANGTPWPIAIADPLQLQESLDMLALGSCGEATSGIDYRRWRKDGIWKHHIIDPRTGEPAITDLLSVTIIAPDTLQAEAAAKVVLILGSQAGLDWLENQSQLAGVLAASDGRLIYSQRIYSRLQIYHREVY
jgi:thiamine biosynthesis lipoprotein